MTSTANRRKSTLKVPSTGAVSCIVGDCALSPLVLEDEEGPGCQKRVPLADGGTEYSLGLQPVGGRPATLVLHPAGRYSAICGTGKPPSLPLLEERDRASADPPHTAAEDDAVKG